MLTETKRMMRSGVTKDQTEEEKEGKMEKNSGNSRGQKNESHISYLSISHPSEV